MKNSGISKSRTNQSTVLPRRRKRFRALGNTVFLLVRLVMWLLRTNQSTVLLWRINYFLLSNSYIGVLVLSVRNTFWNARILHAWTINKRTMRCNHLKKNVELFMSIFLSNSFFAIIIERKKTCSPGEVAPKMIFCIMYLLRRPVWTLRGGSGTRRPAPAPAPTREPATRKVFSSTKIPP